MVRSRDNPIVFDANPTTVRRGAIDSNSLGIEIGITPPVVAPLFVPAVDAEFCAISESEFLGSEVQSNDTPITRRKIGRINCLQLWKFFRISFGLLLDIFGCEEFSNVDLGESLRGFQSQCFRFLDCDEGLTRCCVRGLVVKLATEEFSESVDSTTSTLAIEGNDIKRRYRIMPHFLLLHCRSLNVTMERLVESVNLIYS